MPDRNQKVSPAGSHPSGKRQDQYHQPAQHRFGDAAGFELGGFNADFARKAHEVFPGERVRPLRGELVAERHRIVIVEQDEVVANGQFELGLEDEAVFHGARNGTDVHDFVRADEAFSVPEFFLLKEKTFFVVVTFNLSKGESGLQIKPVGVLRTAAAGEGIIYILAGEEMAITGLHAGIRFDGVGGDQVHFRADETASPGLDAVAAGAARRTVDLVEGVLRVGEPERVIIRRDREFRERLERGGEAHVMNILQRYKIHVAVEFVVGGKKIFKGAVRAVG